MKRKETLMEDVLIVYWSGTGNTETMAEEIARGVRESGSAVQVLEVDSADPALVKQYEKIAFGCPAMGDEELEETEFEPFFNSVEPLLKGKKVALFGSYDWGDGEWMREWSDRVLKVGADLMDDEGFITELEPDSTECVDYGKKFAAF